MVTIYKDGKTARVPAGAVKTHFLPYGWSTTKPKKTKQAASTPPPPPPPNEEDQNDQTPPGDDLSKMNDKELKQYAALLGIEVKGLKSREDILKAIEDAKD